MPVASASCTVEVTSKRLIRPNGGRPYGWLARSKSLANGTSKMLSCSPAARKAPRRHGQGPSASQQTKGWDTSSSSFKLTGLPYGRPTQTAGSTRLHMANQESQPAGPSKEKKKIPDPLARQSMFPSRFAPPPSTARESLWLDLPLSWVNEIRHVRSLSRRTTTHYGRKA
jgi:hypothetical protein